MENDNSEKKFRKILVSPSVLAKLLEVSERTIRNWVQNEGAPREERGEYPLLEYLQWRIFKLEQDIQIAKSKFDEKLIHLKIEGEKLKIKEYEQRFKKFLKNHVILADVKEQYQLERKYIAGKLDELANELLEGIQKTEDQQKRFIIINDLVNAKMLEMYQDKTGLN